MKIAICDDEEKTREYIMSHIKKQYPNAKICCFSTAEELIAGRNFFDICFLDIEMGSVSGIELAKRIRKEQGNSGKRSIIIFVTAFREYMEDAFDVNAFHYLVKPIKEKKFAEVFQRAVNEVASASERREKYIRADYILTAFMIVQGIICVAVYVIILCVYLKTLSRKYIYKGYETSFGENIFLVFPCFAALCVSITLRILILRFSEGVGVLVYEQVPETVFWIIVICILLLGTIIATMMLFQYLIERNEDSRKQAILENQVEQLHREIGNQYNS